MMQSIVITLIIVIKNTINYDNAQIIQQQSRIPTIVIARFTHKLKKSSRLAFSVQDYY